MPTLHLTAIVLILFALDVNAKHLKQTVIITWLPVLMNILVVECHSSLKLLASLELLAEQTFQNIVSRAVLERDENGFPLIQERFEVVASEFH